MQKTFLKSNGIGMGVAAVAVACMGQILFVSAQQVKACGKQVKAQRALARKQHGVMRAMNHRNGLWHKAFLRQ